MSVIQICHVSNLTDVLFSLIHQSGTILFDSVNSGPTVTHSVYCDRSSLSLEGEHLLSSCRAQSDCVFKECVTQSVYVSPPELSFYVYGLFESLKMFVFIVVF